MNRCVLVRVAALVIIGLALLGATPAQAQRAPSATPPLPDGISYPEFQGMGCIVGGAIVALSALTYVEVIAAATAVGAPTTLVVPVMATGFAFGCSVGALMAPGLWWMYRQL